MVSKDSGDIRHHPVHLDGVALSFGRGQQQRLLRFTGLDILQPGPAYHSLVVHLLHELRQPLPKCTRLQLASIGLKL